MEFTPAYQQAVGAAAAGSYRADRRVARAALAPAEAAHAGAALGFLPFAAVWVRFKERWG